VLEQTKYSLTLEFAVDLSNYIFRFPMGNHQIAPFVLEIHSEILHTFKNEPYSVISCFRKIEMVSSFIVAWIKAVEW